MLLPFLKLLSVTVTVSEWFPADNVDGTVKVTVPGFPEKLPPVIVLLSIVTSTAIIGSREFTE